MEFKNQDIIEFFEKIIEGMHITGSYTGVHSGNITACTSVNTLLEDEIIVINDVEYKAFDVTESSFNIKADVSAFTAYNTLTPYFEFGHISEIAQTLTKKEGKILKYQKYPLIILRLDTGSDPEYKSGAFKYSDLNLYICNHTDPTYKAKQRLNENFRPVLFPLYEKFITALKNSLETINEASNFKHKKYDRYNWGVESNYNNTATILNDYLDAVEIQNLSLNIKNIICQQ